jgi:hypothetical protein
MSDWAKDVSGDKTRRTDQVAKQGQVSMSPGTGATSVQLAETNQGGKHAGEKLAPG